MSETNLSGLGLRERYDLQEWIEGTPGILGEDLLIIAKELILLSGKRLDLLAIDHDGNLVVIELKRDESTTDIELQALQYASYVSKFSSVEIIEHYTNYLTLGSDGGVQESTARQAIVDFVGDEELENLNFSQRLILVAGEFRPEVASTVLWLRDYEVEIKCVRLRKYLNDQGELYITPDIIIPLPEAQDYIERKETRQREAKVRQAKTSSFSMEVGNYDPSELERLLSSTLGNPSDLTPRFVTFLDILLSEDKVFSREEILPGLFAAGIGRDMGHTGRYMSGISQLLTKSSNAHLRQCIDFDGGDSSGQQKNNFRIKQEYRPLMQRLVNEWHEYYAPSDTNGA